MLPVAKSCRNFQLLTGSYQQSTKWQFLIQDGNGRHSYTLSKRATNGQMKENIFWRNTVPDEGVVVYLAYCPEIAKYAVNNQRYGLHCIYR